MQLIQSQKKNSRSLGKSRLGKIGAALAAASSGLLHINPVHADDNPWQVDSAVMSYKESGGRVEAVEPIVALKKDFGDEHILNMKFTYDSLTGASPNGAIPTKETVTFSGPSGNGGSSTTSIGELPKNAFEDTRSAFNINWAQPFGDNNHVSVGANYSHENDYLSSGFSAAIAHDFFNKNTTLSLGVNIESDSSKPIGGIHQPLAPNTLDDVIKNSDTKKVTDILLGVTQIVNRHWLTQLSYSYSHSNGYQNDPYKILSVVDHDGNSASLPNDPSQHLYLYEKRPDDRKRQSLFWGNKIHLTEDVVDISLRRYVDDWGIKSNTLDLRYRFEAGHNIYVEPHYRYYTQTKADFYQPFLFDYDVGYLRYASSDPRLAKFNADTIGIKLGYVIGRNSDINIRFETYKQKPEHRENVIKNMPALDGLELNPGLEAKTILLGYSFEF